MSRIYPLAIMASLLISNNLLAVDYADTILTNANIYGHKYANSIAIRNGDTLFGRQNSKS